MTIRSKDYNMLVNLRRNLLSLPQLENMLDSAKRRVVLLEIDAGRINESACGVPTPDYHEKAHAVEEACRVKTVASREPYIQKLKAKQKARQKAFQLTVKVCSVILKFMSCFLSLLLIFCIEKGLLQTDLFNKFGFSHFMGHQWSGWFIKHIDQLSTGNWILLYIMGAALGCALSLLLVNLLTSLLPDNSFTKILHGATKTVSIVMACLSLLAWFIVGCIEVSDWGISGLWWIVAWPLVFLVMVLLVIYLGRILFAALIGLGISVIIIVPFVLGGVCVIINEQIEPLLLRLFSMEKRISKCYKLSFTQLHKLHKTDEYKHAVVQDAEAYATKHANYEQAVHTARMQAKETYADLIVRQTRVVQDIRNRIIRCKHEISSCSIHQSYKNVRTLNELLYYFEYDMASTLQEAVNCRKQDIQTRKIEAQMQAYNKRLDKEIEEIKRLQEIQQKIQHDTEKISDKASDISSELGRINASINSIW